MIGTGSPVYWKVGKMAPEITGERVLKCPVCGARTFYIQRGERPAFFCLDTEGHPLNVLPPGTLPDLPEGVPVACAHCSWSGTVAELLAAQ